MAFSEAITSPWLSTTPLGLPVLPEVYWRKAVEDSSRAGRSRNRPSRSSPATSTTESSPGTCAVSSFETPRAGAKVTRVRVLAFARIPAWRLTWSSSWLSRAGG